MTAKYQKTQQSRVPFLRLLFFDPMQETISFKNNLHLFFFQTISRFSSLKPHHTLEVTIGCHAQYNQTNNDKVTNCTRRHKQGALQTEKKMLNRFESLM